jgi:hypothetical protein
VKGKIKTLEGKSVNFNNTPGFLAAGLRCPIRDLATFGSAT